MRPLKITMTAFGPYKNSETIDFTELKNNRLFVISGNTGAGKTTIFDAICFALYGSASGEDRSESKYLRSDFAEDEVQTAVELEFELHNRLYRIKRQLPHVKKGNKSATGEQYEFYEKVGDREVPCVDRQIVSEINKKVEELVGLTKDQFSQIVMLPQGEFRKLLTSQTENKEEILRKIFRTEPYRWISDRLKEKKKFAEEENKRDMVTRDRYISDIQATLPQREESSLYEAFSQEHYNTNQIITGLEAEIEYYHNEITKNKMQEELTGAAYNSKLEEFHKAEILNEEFQKLEDKESKLTELSSQEFIFKEKEKQYEKANRASKIEVYETQVNDWRQDENHKKQKLFIEEENQKEAIKQLEIAKNTYQIEENKKPERDETARDLDRFQEFLPIVKDIEEKKAELLNNQRAVQKMATEIEALKVTIQSEKSLREQLGHNIREIEQLVEQLGDKQQKLTEMRERVRILQDYLKLKLKQAECGKDFQRKERDFQEIKNQYQQLEVAWLNGQASILAAHLHDGNPCPVCGSIEHPNKAQSHDLIPSKEELETAKKAFDQKDSQYRDAAAMLNTINEHLELKETDVAALGIPVQNAQQAFDQLVKEGKELSNDVEALAEKRNKLKKLKEDLEQKDKTFLQLERKQEDYTKTFQEQNTAFETKKAVYKVQISRIPEQIRNLTELERKISETQALKSKLEQSWETAQNRLQLAKEAETKASAYVLNARNQLEESNTKKQRAEQQFSEALKQAEFTAEEAYRQAKMSERERQQLKTDIDHYHNSLVVLKQQVLEHKENLKDKTKVDLPALESELVVMKKLFDDAQDLVRQTVQYLEKAQELRIKISNAEQSVSQSEKRLTIVADLYDVVRGQNSSKISFERYLQIEYLEQIIVTANERLKGLSNGQFLLIRSDRQESRGKQSGLGLDVFDAYTGQTRDVKTLSGGEKFNASLCLALGMADVIQSFQGGVSIDTMFIDEGFGSLDDESLNKAVDTLIDLQQSGRMIGVISHVQELKNTIPAILEVKKTKEGYSQTKFIIK